MPSDIPARRRKYWATWRQAADILARDGSTQAEIEEERHALHRRTLAGRDPSSNDIVKNRGDFTAVLAAFEAIIHPDDLDRQIRHIRSTDRREQIIWAIRQLGLADSYLDRLSRDCFGLTPWHSLQADELHKLRMTAKSRARSLARQK